MYRNREDTELKYSYDVFGNLSKITDLSSGETLISYEYDGLWRKTKTTDGLGNYEVIKYGKLDRVESVESYDSNNTLLTQTRLKYNDVVKRNDGDLVALEIRKGLPDEALAELRYFDFLGNLVSREQVSKDESISEYYTYDIGGRMTEYTDPLGNRVQNTYDVFGNVVRTKNQAGEITTYTYNLRSQMTGESNGEGYHKYYGYDELGRVVRTREVNAKDILSCRLSRNYYDGNGNLIRAVNALNEESVFEYDALNRLVMQKTGNDKDGILARYRYNELDKITEGAYGAKNPNVTRYEYDRFGRQTRTIDAIGNISYYKYDIVGNLTEKTDRNGVVTRLDYDGLGRLVYEINSKDKTPSVFTYDSNSLMKTAKDATGTYGFSYDGFGRMVKITNPDNLEQIYTYDAGSNITGYEQVRIGTVEHRLSNHYDGLGRLTVVETPAGIVKYEYDGAGRLTREENHGADVNTVYTYSLFNEITGIDIFKNDELAESQRYTYDALGRRASEELRGKLKSYYYDGGNRLKYELVSEDNTSFGERLKSADLMTEYSYDEYNNISIINEWINGKKYEKSFSYDRNNRLVYSRDYEKSVSYGYDNEGNLTEKREQLTGGSYTTAYTYNGKNLMSGMKDYDGILSSYEYRYDGLRANKTVDGVKTAFTYNNGNITSEQVYGEKVQSYQYYRGLRLIAMENERYEKSYFTFNAHGDVIGLDDEEYDYSAFGERLGNNGYLNIDGTWQREEEKTHNPFGYCGEYFDDESGLVYLRARYYDPGLGRFTQEDPIRDGVNWYAYCGNEPINFVDPSGLDAIYLTNKNSANIGMYDAGHTSAIYQDEYGDWYYTYWGNKAVAVIRIPDTYVVEYKRSGDIIGNSMDSLNDFNSALNRFLSENGYSNITKDYTNSTYIIGDFTDSLDEAYKDVSRAFLHSESSGKTTFHKDGSAVYQGKNGAYDLLNSNCLQHTINALKKGILDGFIPVTTYLEENSYSVGTIPNNAIAKFEEMFMNSSFTYYEAYIACETYVRLYEQGSPNASREIKNRYARAVIRRW